MTDNLEIMEKNSLKRKQYNTIYVHNVFRNVC